EPLHVWRVRLQMCRPIDGVTQIRQGSQDRRAQSGRECPRTFRCAAMIDGFCASNQLLSSSDDGRDGRLCHGCLNRSRKCFASDSEENGFCPVTRLRSTTTCEPHG